MYGSMEMGFRIYFPWGRVVTLSLTGGGRGEDDRTIEARKINREFGLDPRGRRHSRGWTFLSRKEPDHGTLPGNANPVGREGKKPDL